MKVPGLPATENAEWLRSAICSAPMGTCASESTFLNSEAHTSWQRESPGQIMEAWACSHFLILLWAVQSWQIPSLGVSLTCWALC